MIGGEAILSLRKGSVSQGFGDPYEGIDISQNPPWTRRSIRTDHGAHWLISLKQEAAWQNLIHACELMLRPTPRNKAKRRRLSVGCPGFRVHTPSGDPSRVSLWPGCGLDVFCDAESIRYDLGFRWRQTNCRYHRICVLICHIGQIARLCTDLWRDKATSRRADDRQVRLTAVSDRIIHKKEDWHGD